MITSNRGGDKIMKYLTKDLYIYSSLGGKTFNDNKDKFFIGYLNKDKNKLKDVVTNQIVEVFSFLPFYDFDGSKKNEVNYALMYMTLCGTRNTSIRLLALSRYIGSVSSKDTIELREIAKVKAIMNREITAAYNKKCKDDNKLNKKTEELQKYSIKESQRDF